VCRPLTDLLSKNGKWYWTATCDEAFKYLQELFTSESVICHFYPSCRTVVEIDAVEFVQRVVLFQYGKDGKLHPVAFYFKKNLPTEINFDIHDKEIGASVASFREWEHPLNLV
jgi:hypothetical protein